MFKEFKEFVMRGNVVDLAVGVIIGGAFGKIVTSLVNDLLMPPIGLIVGNVDFSDLSVSLKAADETGKGVAVNYGMFVNNVINFLIVAFCVFIVVKIVNSLHKKPAAVPNTKECPQCLSAIPKKAVRCAFCTSTVAALILLAVLLAPVRASAEDVPPAKRWKNSTEASLVSANGNTKSTTYAVKDTYNYGWKKTMLELIGGALGAESNNVTTAEKYMASEKMTRKVDDRNYLYEKGEWNKDRFAGIHNRYEGTAGVGRELIKDIKNYLVGEIGAGYTNEQRINARKNDFATGRAYSKYVRTVSPTSNFSQDAEYLANFENSDDFRVNTETALTAAIDAHFSLKVGYTWHHVGQPPVGFHRNDTLTSVALIASY